MKKLLSVLLIAGMLCSLAACGGKDEVSDTTGTQTQQNETQSNNETQETNKAEFESNTLVLVEKAEPFQGIINDIKSDGTFFYVLANNKLYQCGTYYEEYTEVKGDGMEIAFTYGGSALCTKNGKGEYILQTKVNGELQTQTIKVDNPFWISYSNGDIYTFEDDKVYIENKSEDDYYRLNKTQLTFESDLSNIEITEVKDIYNFNNTTNFILTYNNQVFSVRGNNSYGIFSTSTGSDGLCIWIGESAELNNVDKLWGMPSGSCNRPVHSLVGDEDNLYTYTYQATEVGIPEEEYKVIMKLPEGVKTHNIKRAVVNEGILIETVSGEIYTSDSIKRFSEFKLNEELTGLNQQGKIQDIIMDDDIIIVLMIDHKLYEVK